MADTNMLDCKLQCPKMPMYSLQDTHIFSVKVGQNAGRIALKCSHLDGDLNTVLQE